MESFLQRTGNLAARLAMQCKGTAWNQVRMLDPTKLTAAETGVEYLLDALSSWEETSEMKTFKLFEKALYKVVQKSDEAAKLCPAPEHCLCRVR